LIRIVTQLDKDAALAALRELAPKEHDARFFSFKSTFEGQIDPQRLVIGYRWGSFNPPVRLATFSGRIRETDAGTKMHGNISSGWIIYIYAAWLIVVPPLALIQAALAQDFSGVLWVLVIAISLFFLGRAFVRSTQDYVVNEIRRAVRGKVEKD
jgi:hypothetical protein